MIVFRDVTKKYGSEDIVLDKINFLIEKGSFVFLVGPTGSGKTTIFRLLIRDLLPSEGEINVGEWDIVNLSKTNVPTLRRTVGVVFQDLKLLHDRTVVENVILPLLFTGVAEEEARKRAEEILIDVGLEDKIEKFPAQLSGGERQRVAIARALIFNPDVILADEPTGNLDTQTSFQILDLLKSINKKGTTIFMATHNDVLINSGTDRVIVLEKGKIKEDRKPTGKHVASEVKKDKEEKPEEKEVKKDKEIEKEEDEKKHKADKKGTIKLEVLAKKDTSFTKVDEDKIK